MKKKYIITGILVFLFSAISIYLILDTGKSTYAIDGDDYVDGENGAVVPPLGDCYFSKSQEKYVWLEGDTVANSDYVPSEPLINDENTREERCLRSNNYLDTLLRKWQSRYEEKLANGTINDLYLDNVTSPYPYRKVTGATYKKYYIIKYNRNYTGASEIPEVRKYYNEDITIKDKINRNGQVYEFKEWNTQANGRGTSYAPNSPYSRNSSLTLYAIWRENVARFCNIYDIIIDKNDNNALVVGKTIQYQAIVEGASDEYISTYTWSSSDSNVFSISSSTGANVTIRANGAGTATLRLKIKLTDGTECSTTYTKQIEIKSNQVNLGCNVAEFSLTPSGKIEIQKGKTKTIEVLVEGITPDNVSSYTWESSNSKISINSNNGSSSATITGVSTGTATLTVTPKIGTTNCSPITKEITITSTNTEPNNPSTPDNPSTPQNPSTPSTTTQYTVYYDCGNYNGSKITCTKPSNQTSGQSTIKISSTKPQATDYKFLYWSVDGSNIRFCNPTSYCDNSSSQVSDSVYFGNGKYGTETTLIANWQKINNTAPGESKPEETIPETSSSMNNNEVSPQTGSIPVYIAFLIGLGALGYSYYYTKKLKEN